MAKIINITDKLSFDKNPVIVIRDTEIPVNDDAVTMLKIMDMLGDDETANASNIACFSSSMDRIFSSTVFSQRSLYTSTFRVWPIR